MNLIKSDRFALLRPELAKPNPGHLIPGCTCLNMGILDWWILSSSHCQPETVITYSAPGHGHPVACGPGENGTQLCFTWGAQGPGLC